MRAVRILIALLLACAAIPAFAQTAGTAPIYGRFGPGLLDYQGTLGSVRIGLTLVIDNDPAPHGSYFYFKHLQDIPLKGSFEHEGFELQEYNSLGKIAGTLHLKLSTEGISKIEKPLTLGNTSTLAGTWTSADGARTLPVLLKQMGWMSGTEANRYGDFGSNSAVEQNVRKFYDAVQHGNRQVAADAVDYPVRVNSLRLRIANKQQFLANYNRIFTSGYVHCLAGYPPHNLFANTQGIMLGRGELWFNGKGLISINPCISH